MNKESLRKLTIQELEGQLIEVKENYKAATIAFSVERQKQLLKSKTIKGKASKRKEELIRQILKIQKETQRIQAQTLAVQAASTSIKTSYKSYKGKHTEKFLEEEYDREEYGAIIKKYEEYIKRGLIRRQSALNKYEAADWFADNYMSKEDMERAIAQADEWRAMSRAKSSAKAKAEAQRIAEAFSIEF